MLCSEKPSERSQQDAGEFLQILLAVKAVAAFAAARRDETAFLTLLERARRDADPIGRFADGEQFGLVRRDVASHRGVT